jgi:hypothetical protein
MRTSEQTAVESDVILLNTGPSITFPPTRILSLPLVGHHLQCSECGADFTGTYCHSDLMRHVRAEHAQGPGNTHPCKATGCDKVFQRKLARLEHELKRHPELSLVSARQKQNATGNVFAPFMHDREWYLDIEVPTNVYVAHRFPTGLHRDDDDILHAIKGVGAWQMQEPGSLHHERTRSNLVHTHSSEFNIIESIKETGAESIGEPRLVHHETIGSSLVSTYASDRSLTHDRDSVFSCDNPSGTTSTDASDTLEPSNLQHTESIRVGVSKEPGLCLEPDMDELDHEIENEATYAFDWAALYPQEKTKSSPQIFEAAAGQVQYLNRADLSVGAIMDMPRASPADSKQVACMVSRSEPSDRERTRSQPLVDNRDDSIGFCTSDRQVLPPLGQYLIDWLKAELDPEMYLRHWTCFFRRWEGILEVMESRR